MANLCIISGCNGVCKTTASYSVLRDMLNCKEFVNADEIAKGLSPFQPDKVALESGRIMLSRIKDLLNHNPLTAIAVNKFLTVIKIFNFYEKVHINDWYVFRFIIQRKL